MAEIDKRFLEFRQGATRNVILCGKLAFKFPRVDSWRLFLNGLLANSNERKFWKKNKKVIKLCPVRFGIWGGSLNVMPRASEISKQEFRNLKIKTWRQIYGGTALIPVENKIDSFGKTTGGAIVAIDYGSA